ncbi:Retrovirus-related Pol polyprotein from transposon 17.6 [Vitis vinifera]|uniref:Retrovirus-related Pol polyprotein from transposon 17.6 n=1 Tax=Vitis vinifera TaxID=29760 RepID=A0A438CMD1_VITVI|nr:Retrovirus-related Pol polyprotein from transposon 17.6 [Vitis vinifera]
MEDEAKPVRQPQRRLNPHMQEVVRAEVLKLLQAGEDVSTRSLGWRVCIDYRRLNAVTRNDHFPLPFIDQIEIDVEDQEKTTLHAHLEPMHTGECLSLCNAPATFQRCMLSIFSDMVERIMEVFMDDITIYGMPFHGTQGIVLGHIISKQGIEVDKAKVELIVKLPSPTNVKGVRQFLGHAGFYRRFIKDFSKLARPLCELLVKDAKFIWDDRCQRSFEELKLFLTTAPIVRAPNWQLPFEVMCDASDFAIGAVLGKEKMENPM